MTRRGLLVIAAAVGVVGAAGLAIGAAAEPAQAAFAYLTAWAFATSIAIGALLLIMLGYATGARWLAVFRNFTGAIASALPVLALGFVPVALSIDRLYPWAAPEGRGLDPDTLHKLAHAAPYDNAPAFVIRAAGCFAIWIVAAELLRRRVNVRVVGAVGLPVVMITATLAAFDWLMDLTPAWTSTMFGLIYIGGGFMGALALTAVLARAARKVALVRDTITDDHTGALGRLVFAFMVFWFYLEFGQGLITWIANKPDEVPFFVTRATGGWQVVLGVLIIGGFVLPFLVMLGRGLKRNPTALAVASAYLLVLHYVDDYWMVMPALHAELAPHWLDLAAPAAVIGLATAFAAARTRRALPSEDPQWAAALRYREDA